MSIRFIASVAIAALLMTGGAAATGQITEYGVHPAQEQQTTLTKEKAKTIALTHAGLAETEVTGLRVEYDMERGTPEWDVDFRSGDWEYDYEIHAETGAVIKSEKEFDPAKPVKSTQPTQAQPQATEPSQTEKLTAAEAKGIALNHAGLAESQVKGLRAEYDGDGRVPEWEVEFYADGMEHDYEIHAETGEIRSWDKERDD